MSKKRGRPIKGDSPLKVRMGFRISDELLEEVELACKEREIKKTDFIVEAIKHHLRNQRLLEWGL